MDVHCQGLMAIFLTMAVGHVESQNVSNIAPECYDDETCPCCSVPCPSDRSGFCDNNCTDGYHGKKCHNKCPFNCISCVDAQHGTGVSNCTLCKDGYFSTVYLYQCQSACSSNCKTCKSSSIQCTSCTGDYYLAVSNACLQCNESCKTCSPEGSCTSCMEGFYLDHAQGQCYKCNPLCSSCNSSDTCFCSNGCVVARSQESFCEGRDCTYGCLSNFMSSDKFRSLCDKCVNGNYGIDCDLKCSANCDLNGCQRLSGHCFGCKPGFHGYMCELACPKICKTSCERNLGFCDSSLPDPVYYGLDCELQCQESCKECIITNGSCITCVDGFFGDECEKTCSENCQNRKCNKKDGSCECVSGYMGPPCHVRSTINATTSSDAPNKYHEAIVGITMVSVVIIVGLVGISVWWHRRRQNGNGSGSNTANTSDIKKVETELASISKQIIKLTSRSSNLEAKLDGLKKNIPFQHTDRADKIDDTSYEMLQQHNKETPYSSLK